MWATSHGLYILSGEIGTVYTVRKKKTRGAQSDAGKGFLLCNQIPVNCTIDGETFLIYDTASNPSKIIHSMVPSIHHTRKN